jgi:hypothetical protein
VRTLVKTYYDKLGSRMFQDQRTVQTEFVSDHFYVELARVVDKEMLK